MNPVIVLTVEDLPDLVQENLLGRELVLLELLEHLDRDEAKLVQDLSYHGEVEDGFTWDQGLELLYETFGQDEIRLARDPLWLGLVLG